MYESKDKMVSHPDHYQSKKGLEVIDVIEAFTDGLEGIEATDTGNIIKYICRWKKKGGVQDLEKVLWYTQHLIDYLNKNSEISSKELSENDSLIIILLNDYMPVFFSEKEALQVLDRMNEVVRKYGVCSVLDVYDLSGYSSDDLNGTNPSKLLYKARFYGWTNLSGADIYQTDDGYKLKLPEMKKL